MAHGAAAAALMTEGVLISFGRLNFQMATGLFVRLRVRRFNFDARYFFMIIRPFEVVGLGCAKGKKGERRRARLPQGLSPFSI